MCNCNHEKEQSGGSITRRDAIKKCLIFMGGLLLSILGIFMPSRKAQAGAGRCGVSGCPCPQYQQAYGTDLCGNCGHQYGAHW
jgi:hypothetical protein